MKKITLEKTKKQKKIKQSKILNFQFLPLSLALYPHPSFYTSTYTSIYNYKIQLLFTTNIYS